MNITVIQNMNLRAEDVPVSERKYVIANSRLESFCILHGSGLRVDNYQDSHRLQGLLLLSIVVPGAELPDVHFWLHRPGDKDSPLDQICGSGRVDQEFVDAVVRGFRNRVTTRLEPALNAALQQYEHITFDCVKNLIIGYRNNRKNIVADLGGILGDTA